jgi:GNAT superfamily N-acetyltransferase
MTDIDGPLATASGLEELRPLFTQLHRHHLSVATYQPLVADLDESWTLRRRWYEEILVEGGRYFVARDESATPIGYGLAAVTLGADDTFEVHGGIVEIVSLVVDEAARGQGVGRQLMGAMERLADEYGADLLKVAVMSGNRSAESFYSTLGFVAGEQVLYRPVDRRTTSVDDRS